MLHIDTFLQNRQDARLCTFSRTAPWTPNRLELNPGYYAPNIKFYSLLQGTTNRGPLNLPTTLGVPQSPWIIFSVRAYKPVAKQEPKSISWHHLVGILVFHIWNFAAIALFNRTEPGIHSPIWLTILKSNGRLLTARIEFWSIEFREITVLKASLASCSKLVQSICYLLVVQHILRTHVRAK